MEGALRLMHPFMPFITEEVWQALPHGGETLMHAPWPEVDAALSFPQEERDFSVIVEAIRAIRARRAEMNVPPSKKARLQIETQAVAVFAQGVPFIERLCSASEVEIGNAFDTQGAVQVLTSDARILIPLAELIDPEKERERLTKEKAAVLKDIEVLEKKLGSPAFVEKAKPEVVAAQREKLASAQQLLAKIEEGLAAVGV